MAGYSSSCRPELHTQTALLGSKMQAEWGLAQLDHFLSLTLPSNNIESAFGKPKPNSGQVKGKEGKHRPTLLFEAILQPLSLAA